MDSSISVAIHDTSDEKPVNFVSSEHLYHQSILRSSSTSFFRTIFKSIRPKLFQFIFIGIVIFLLVTVAMIGKTGCSSSLRMIQPVNIIQTIGKPRLAIVMTLTTDFVHRPYVRLSAGNKQAYAKRHGYDFILDAAIDDTRTGMWSKIVTLHSVMHSRPEIEWFWFLDGDAFILEKNISIYDHVVKKYQWGTTKEQNISKDILISEDCGGPHLLNTGSFLIRNTQWSKSAMRTVYEKQHWDPHYVNAEQDTMRLLYRQRADWQQKVQTFPMRLANSFPHSSCGERHRVQYQDGDMVIHYAGYRQSIPSLWPGELQKWRAKGKLVDDVEVDILLK